MIWLDDIPNTAYAIADTGNVCISCSAVMPSCSMISLRPSLISCGAFFRIADSIGSQYRIAVSLEKLYDISIRIVSTAVRAAKRAVRRLLPPGKPKKTFISRIFALRL